MTDKSVNQHEAPPSTSASLLDRARQQNQAAWERLVSLYSPLVYRWCRQFGLQPADAADVGQEVFRAVARALADFRRDRQGDTFRGWLRTITRNKIRDHLRRNQGEPPGVGGSDALRRLHEAPGQDPDSQDPAAEAEDKRVVFLRAVELIRMEFEDKTWQAFWRVAVELQMPEDVANDLGITVNAVYLAKSRVRRRLREEFASLVES